MTTDPVQRISQMETEIERLRREKAELLHQLRVCAEYIKQGWDERNEPQLAKDSVALIAKAGQAEKIS